MRAVWNIALNDLRATFSQRGVLVSLLLVPIVITVVLGLATRSNSGVSVFVIDVIDRDAGVYSAQVIDQLRTEGRDRFAICILNAPERIEQPSRCAIDAAKVNADIDSYARARLTDTDALTTLIFPQDFSATIDAGGSTPLTIIGRSDLNAPQSIRQLVDSALNRLNGSIAAGRVIDQIRPGSYQQAYDAAAQIWASEPVRITETTGGDTAVMAGTGFGQSVPGIGAMYVLINALAIAQVFFQERQNGVMARMLVIPIKRWQILAGKILGRVVVCLFVFAVLIVVGTLFGTRWGDPIGVVVTAVLYTLAVVAIAVTFSTLVRSRSQAGSLALLLTFILAPLGGAWWPLSIVPAWMQTLGRLSPIAWSQEAFSRLIFYNASVIDILPQLGVLLLFAAVFFAIGITRFRYE